MNSRAWKLISPSSSRSREPHDVANRYIIIIKKKKENAILMPYSNTHTVKSGNIHTPLLRRQ